MSIFGDNPYGPRRLARDYAQHKRQKDREEIRRRISEKGGSNHASTWDEMEEIWLDGGLDDDNFEDLSVGLMDNTELRPQPTADLPQDLTQDP